MMLDIVIWCIVVLRFQDSDRKIGKDQDCMQCLSQLLYSSKLLNITMSLCRVSLLLTPRLVINNTRKVYERVADFAGNQQL